jgi:hypothetical protein
MEALVAACARVVFVVALVVNYQIVWQRAHAREVRQPMCLPAAAGERHDPVPIVRGCGPEPVTVAFFHVTAQTFVREFAHAIEGRVPRDDWARLRDRSSSVRELDARYNKSNGDGVEAMVARNVPGRLPCGLRFTDLDRFCWGDDASVHTIAIDAPCAGSESSSRQSPIGEWWPRLDR